MAGVLKELRDSDLHITLMLLVKGHEYFDLPPLHIKPFLIKQGDAILNIYSQIERPES